MMTATSLSHRPARSALLGEPGGELILRLRIKGQEERLIRLTGAKSSIGSGEACSLRLRAPGVDATHCLILRGPEGTVIRGLGKPLAVNGQVRQESRLQPGDVFELGKVALEVVSDSCVRPGNSKQRRDFLAPNTEPISQQTAETRQETRRQQHARLRKLLDALRRDRRKAAEQERESSRRRKEMEQLQVQLSHLQREIAEERDQAQRIEDQRRASASQANQLQVSLERLRHELHTLQLQQQQEADLFRQERSRLNEDLSTRERQAHQLRMELQQRHWDLEQLRLQLDRQQRQADLEREQVRAQSAQRQQEQEAWLAERTKINEEFALRERQANQLQGDLKAAQTACQQLQLELSKATSALQQAQMAAEARERALKCELGELRAARDESIERERWAKELEIELAQQQATSERLERDLKQARGQIAQLTEEAAELRDRWMRDREIFQAAEGQPTANESSHVEHTRLLEALTTREKEIDRVRAELRQVVENLSQAHRQLEEQALASVAREGAWTAERSALQSNIQALESSQKKSNDERQQAQTRVAALEAERAAAEAKRQAIEQEMERVAGQLAEANSAVETWKRSAEEGQTRIEQLEKKVASQSAMLAAQSQQTIALDMTKSQRFQTLERQVAELTTEREGLTRRVEELVAQLDRQAAEATAGCETLQTQQQELVHREQVLQEERAQLDARQAELEAQAAALATREAAVAECDGELAIERQKIEQRHTELAAQATQLSEREASLHAETLSLQTAKQELLANTLVAPKSIDPESAPSSVGLEQLEKDRSALAEEREQLAHERGDIERVREQLAEERNALAEQEHLLEEKLRQIEQEREALHASRQELAAECERISSVASAAISEPPESQEPPPKEEPAASAFESRLASPAPAAAQDEQDFGGQTLCPAKFDLSRLASMDLESESATASSSAAPIESVEEVLARLGRQGLWKQETEEEQAPAQAASVESPTPEEFEQEPSPPASSMLNSGHQPQAASQPAWRNAEQNPMAAEEGEESIDAYMARLMNRVQGSDPAKPATPAKLTSFSRPSMEEPETKTAPQTKSDGAPAAPAGEFSPRSAAPEQSHSLAAMREIANESARSAIRTHEKKTGKVRRASHLLSALVLAALSCPMLWLSWQFHSWLFAAGFGIGLCLSAWWLRGTFFAACRLLVPRKSSRD